MLSQHLYGSTESSAKTDSSEFSRSRPFCVQKEVLLSLTSSGDQIRWPLQPRKDVEVRAFEHFPLTSLITAVANVPCYNSAAFKAVVSHLKGPAFIIRDF